MLDFTHAETPGKVEARRPLQTDGPRTHSERELGGYGYGQGAGLIRVKLKGKACPQAVPLGLPHEVTQICASIVLYGEEQR